jgi:hypothetical protein
VVTYCKAQNCQHERELTSDCPSSSLSSSKSPDISFYSIVRIVYLFTLETSSTYLGLLRSAVNVLCIHENSNCPCWLPLYHLFHHVFIFGEVLDIACISLTWVKWPVIVTNTSKGQKKRLTLKVEPASYRYNVYDL